MPVSGVSFLSYDCLFELSKIDQKSQSTHGLYTLMPKILKCLKKSEKILKNTTGNAEYFDVKNASVGRFVIKLWFFKVETSAIDLAN